MSVVLLAFLILALTPFAISLVHSSIDDGLPVRWPCPRLSTLTDTSYRQWWWAILLRAYYLLLVYIILYDDASKHTPHLVAIIMAISVTNAKVTAIRQ